MRLLNWFGKRTAAVPESTGEAVNRPPEGETAIAVGSNLYATSDFPRYNPDQLLAARGTRVYKQMMLDEQLKAVVHFKRDAVTARDWYLEYDDDVKLSDEEKERRIHVIEEAIESMDGSFVDALNGIMSAMQNGFSIVEKVFDMRELTEVDGKTYVIVKALKLRPFDTFYFYCDDYGNILRFVQRGLMGQETDLEMDRFIHFVVQSDVDPLYGQSELREAYRAWFNKEHILKMRNIYLERMAGGLVWIEAEKGSGVAARSQLATDLQLVLQSISTTTGILLPPGLKLQVSYPVGKDTAFDGSIAMEDMAMAKALLVPNLLGISEQGSRGGYAQASTQLEAFLWTLDKLAERLAETINEQLIEDLGEYNFGDGVYPEFCFHPISDTVKMNIIGRWKDLVTAGAVEVTNTDEKHLRELLDFPDKGEPIKQPVAPGIGPDGKPLLGPDGPSVPAGDDTQKAPGSQGTSGQKQPIGADKLDETVIGKGRLKTSAVNGKVAMSRAIKRVDFAVIDVQSTNITHEGTQRAVFIIKSAINNLKKQVIEEDVLTTSKVDSIRIPANFKSDLKAVTLVTLKEAWGFGLKHAKKEIAKAKGSSSFAANLVLDEAAAEAFLNSRSFTLSGDTFAGIEKQASTILYNAIKSSWTLADTLTAFDDFTASNTLPHLATAIRTITFEAINEARYDFFSSPEMATYIEALEYSAIIDGKTTEICQELDGRTWAVDDAMWDKYTPPNHFNCRSLLIAVTVDDKWEPSSDPNVEPQESFFTSKGVHSHV